MIEYFILMSFIANKVFPGLMMQSKDANAGKLCEVDHILQ